MEDRQSGAKPSASVSANVALTPAPARSAPAPNLRDHLPGLEPERHVTDWGRSELVEGVLDRTLYDFLYHYWFRVEVEGIENVPTDEPALLAANQAGALRADAAMIAKAIRERHRQPRPVHFATERPLGNVPGLDMLIVKAGGINAHPANLHRLLFDERQLVLVFPEGGSSGPLRDRYRVRRFARADLLGAALRARAPIVPVAVLGSEEAAPVLSRLPRSLRFAPLPFAMPLPAKIRIRFLPAVDPDSVPDLARAPAGAGDGDGTADPIAALGAGVRALIQENLLEMLARRRSVWLG